MANPSSQKKPEEQGKVKDKFSETISNITKNDKIEGLYSYAKSNTMDTVAYVFLIVGIVLMFFASYALYGGALIGIVTGVYFSDEITQLLRNINEFVEKQGIVRSLIIGGLTLALFISAPTIFLFAAVTVGLKQLISPHKGS